jgi:hypothetical protein
MGRVLAFIFVFLIGGVIGFVLGGLGGGAVGAYAGACAVINSGVERGSLSQDDANALVKAVAVKLDIDPKQKERIVDSLKESGNSNTPCQKAIEAL